MSGGPISTAHGGGDTVLSLTVPRIETMIYRVDVNVFNHEANR